LTLDSTCKVHRPIGEVAPSINLSDGADAVAVIFEQEGRDGRFSEIATQQSIQQLLQHELVYQVHSRELDANAITGDTISHERLCPHASAGHFKRQPEFRAHGRWIGRGNEQTLPYLGS
jgi:hypothetical protein